MRVSEGFRPIAKHDRPILELVSEGRSYRWIARELQVDKGTGRGSREASVASDLGAHDARNLSREWALAPDQSLPRAVAPR